jgi:hypothetical protein
VAIPVMGNHIYLTLLGLQRRKNTIFITAAFQQYSNTELAECKTLDSEELNLFGIEFNILCMIVR